jgi:hypothetical protein
MLLLIAALIAAEVSEEARIAEASLQAGLGMRGERRAELSARAGADGISMVLGAAQSAGPESPEREELLLGFESPTWRGELRVVPGSAGLTRGAGELGVHFETWSLVLGGRAASLGRTSMSGIGARFELEGEPLEGIRAGASVSGWALWLDAPRSADPWAAWGAATLDWGQRWEAGAWASREFFGLSLTPAVNISEPPQAGAFEARASIVVELQIGPVKLRVDGGAGHLWPARFWHGEIGAGVTMNFY